MKSEERKRMLDALSQEERMRVIRRCANRTMLSPLGLAITALPFVLLGIFAVVARRMTLTTTHSVVFVVGTTVVMVAGVTCLTIFKGQKVMDEVLENIQQGH